MTCGTCNVHVYISHNIHYMYSLVNIHVCCYFRCTYSWLDSKLGEYIGNW